jgi:hypothetical protein
MTKPYDATQPYNMRGWPDPRPWAKDAPQYSAAECMEHVVYWLTIGQYHGTDNPALWWWEAACYIEK